MSKKSAINGCIHMASTTTRVKTIRIKNETVDYFEGKPLNRMVESLYDLLTSGKIEFDGESLVVKGCTPTNNRGVPQDFEDIEEMADLMRVPTNKLLSDFRQLLEDGTLYYSGVNLVNPRYEEFERLCEAKKQDPDRMMANVVRSMGG